MHIFAISQLFSFTCFNAAEPLRIALFKGDATPQIGLPIVLCAVDWIGIGNGGHNE